MPADSQSPLLGLLMMGTGNQNNSWGDSFNNEATIPIEQAIADVTSIATTGGTTTLTALQARSHSILLTGTLASDAVLVVPDTNKPYRIINNTVGGGFFTRLKCVTAATAVNIPAGGKITTVIAAGGVPYREDSCEVGRYVFDGASLTGDVLEANGAAYKRTALPELFAKYGTTYGNNDATDFKVPNAYTAGKFLRSRTAALTVGTAQASQNKDHTHTGSGTTATQSANHTHTGSGTTSTISVDHNHSGSGNTGGRSADHTHTGSGNTGTFSSDHTHSGTTGGTTSSIDHLHAYSGTSASMNRSNPHSHTFTAVQQVGGNLAGGGAFGIAQTTSTSSVDINHEHTYSGTSGAADRSLDHSHNFSTGGSSANHTHFYSFTTSGESIDHSHFYSFTTTGVSANHTHTYSFTSSNESGTHTHTYSFTTSGGSADGAEARPESLVGILCIRY